MNNFKFTVVSDIDCTVAPSDKAWKAWLENVTGTQLPDITPTSRLNYDLTTYVKEELAYNGMTGYEFWHMSFIYHNMNPIEGSVEALKSIVDMGGRLVFVSHELGLHGASKRAFIDRHFPFATATLLTADIEGFNNKSLVETDYIIEDRYSGLTDFNRELTKGIILNTPYIDPKPVDIDYIVCDNWFQILKHFEEEVCTK
jgi:5'(3')-deoxyribonucleotidase